MYGRLGYRRFNSASRAAVSPNRSARQAVKARSRAEAYALLPVMPRKASASAGNSSGGFSSARAKTCVGSSRSLPGALTGGDTSSARAIMNARPIPATAAAAAPSHAARQSVTREGRRRWTDARIRAASCSVGPFSSSINASSSARQVAQSAACSCTRLDTSPGSVPSRIASRRSGATQGSGGGANHPCSSGSVSRGSRFLMRFRRIRVATADAHIAGVP